MSNLRPHFLIRVKYFIPFKVFVYLSFQPIFNVSALSSQNVSYPPCLITLYCASCTHTYIYSVSSYPSSVFPELLIFPSSLFYIHQNISISSLSSCYPSFSSAILYSPAFQSLIFMLSSLLFAESKFRAHCTQFCYFPIPHLLKILPPVLMSFKYINIFAFMTIPRPHLNKLSPSLYFKSCRHYIMIICNRTVTPNLLK